MIKYKKSLFILWLIFIFRILICLFSYKEINYKVYIKEIGFITKIKKENDKTVLDIKSKEKYKITLYKNVKFNLGDKVYFEGSFKTPNNNTVFNLFNYKKYLLSKNIKLISNDCKVVLKKKNTNILYSIKTNIIEHINKYKSKNYLNAFILADTSYIEKYIIENYRNIGISHLFAISGMHVGCLIFILNLVLKKIKFKNLLIVLFLFFYLFISGFTESLLRCFVFLNFTYINKYFKLNISSLYIIITTALFLLFINPYLIYNIGFIFSVTITFFIILSKDKIKNKRYIEKTFITSLISFLATIPILSYAFFKVNLLTPIINVLFIPIVSFIIFPLGIITFIVPFLDNIFFNIVNFFEYLTLLISKIDFLSFALCKNIIFVLLYYIFLILSLCKNKKYILIFIILLIININFKYFVKTFDVTCFDVEQGDSTLIVTPNSKNILIDTGGVYYKKGLISKNKIIPYLNSIGINCINYLILTHGDYDHMGEAINLVNTFKVENVIFNCGEYNDLENELIKALDKKKINYYSCIKELNIDKHKLQFLNTGVYDNENDNSSVIYLDYNNYKFLFMGDASIEREKDILEKYNLKDIDFLKVGHHGSNTSSSKEFINSINPKYSLISVGKNNRYGHPKESVLDTLNNSKIYRTDLDGSITFKIKKNKLEINTCPP